MLRNLLPLLFTVLISTVNAQSYIHPCGTDEYVKHKLSQDPIFEEQREEFYRNLEKFIDNRPLQSGKTEEDLRVIPIVFHVMHAGGPENISQAQILDQIRILNEDFRRTNPDTGKIPAPFKSLAVDANIEFRLAQKDPQGKCTDGIVRVYTSLTNEANDKIKALSYWDSDKYFNVWVVKNIKLDGVPSNGIVQGYAQFPAFGDKSTDGVVIRADATGTIEYVTSFAGGRTLTHEAGHWFGLQHIWGDSNCGSDGVSDTPPQSEANFGCPVFPKASSCSGSNADGEMFMNYMDYSNDECRVMFTKGQKNTRMDFVLSSVRQELYSAANLIATGTDGSPAKLCAPVADFAANTTMICEGATVSYTQSCWNGEPDSFKWTFTGGSPATSTEEKPVVTYAKSGVYEVTLEASNSGGSDAKTIKDYILVSSLEGNYKAPYQEGVENATQVNNDWIIENEDNSNFKWSRTTIASKTGNASFWVNNFSNVTGTKESIISPPIDLTTIDSPELFFKVAYARKNANSSDALRVYFSNNCGHTWQSRFIRAGSQLATRADRNTNFLPADSEWKEHKIFLLPYSNQKNLRIKFEFTSGGGNNIFIDDINIKGVVSVNDHTDESVQLEVFPNPMTKQTNIQYVLNRPSDVGLNIFDITGRSIFSETPGKQTKGPNTFVVTRQMVQAPGVYFIELKINDSRITKKLIIE